MHNYFSQLRMLFEAGKDEEYGLKLNSVFRNIFGNRVIV